MVIVVGCGSLLYVVGGFIQMATEGEINRAFGAQRMTRGIEKLEGHTIICGFGRMGQIMAKELLEEEHRFVIIDSDDERVLEADSLGYLAMVGDATSEDLLEKARIKQASSLATVLPSDAMNVFQVSDCPAHCSVVIRDLTWRTRSAGRLPPSGTRKQATPSPRRPLTQENQAGLECISHSSHTMPIGVSGRV